jgi:CRP-like cAMP-binding protein
VLHEPGDAIEQVYQMTVQLGGAALTMPKANFVDAYRAHPHLRNLVDRYQAILLMQAQQNAACHALHSVRSRLCRWLLQYIQPDPGIS